MHVSPTLNGCFLHYVTYNQPRLYFRYMIIPSEVMFGPQMPLKSWNKQKQKRRVMVFVPLWERGGEFIPKMNLGKPAWDVMIGKTFLSDSCGLCFHFENTDSLVTLASKIKIGHISSQPPIMLEHAHIFYCFIGMAMATAFPTFEVILSLPCCHNKPLLQMQEGVVL